MKRALDILKIVLLLLYPALVILIIILSIIR